MSRAQPSFSSLIRVIITALPSAASSGRTFRFRRIFVGRDGGSGLYRHGRLFNPAGLGDLGAKIRQANDAPLFCFVQERNQIPPYIDPDHLFGAVGRPDRLTFAGEAFPCLEIGVVLVRQTAHQATAGTGNLGGIEREPLVLGELQRDRLDFA